MAVIKNDELLQFSRCFQGENDIEQIVWVFRILGTPSESNWPGMKELPDFAKITFPQYPAVPLSQVKRKNGKKMKNFSGGSF